MQQDLTCTLLCIGTVRERVGNGRQYIIEWADQSVQLQVQPKYSNK